MRWEPWSGLDPKFHIKSLSSKVEVVVCTHVGSLRLNGNTFVTNRQQRETFIDNTINLFGYFVTKGNTKDTK